jgi:hypothetical protein
MKKILLLSSVLCSFAGQAQYAHWAQAYTGLSEYTLPREISASGAENLAFCGTYRTSNFSVLGGYLYKTDSMGTILWTDSAMLSNPETDFSTYFMTSALDFDQGENLYFALNFNDTLTFGASTYPAAGNNRSIMVKYLDDGTKDFLQLYENASIHAITHDAANNTVVLISFSGTLGLFSESYTAVGARDLLIASFNSSNTVVFSKQIHGTITGTDIEVTAAGNYVVLGNFTDTLHYDGTGQMWSHSGSPDAFILKVAPTGTVLAYVTAIATIMDREDDIVVSLADEVAMSGHGSWTYNAWGRLQTYDQMLNETSSQFISDDDYASYHDITDLVVVGNDGYWGLGSTRLSYIEADPSDDENYITLYKYDFMGNQMDIDSFLIAASYFDRSAKAMTAGHAGNFYISVPLEGSVTFGSHTVTSSGSQPGFLVAKFNESPGISTAINEEDKGLVTIFPNPGRGLIRVQSNFINPVIRIYDVAGRMVFSKVLMQMDETIDTGLAEGMYNVQVSGAEAQVFNTKIIVMK